MARLPNAPIFDVIWNCICGKQLHWIGAEALVYSQTGKVVVCRVCDTVWRLTPAGAQQLSE